ncbi:MAG: DegV family protein [Chloroflexi bacterium]|nr:DegV family protein [Chloroflexota bacterium]
MDNDTMNNESARSLFILSLFIEFMPRVRIVTDSTAHFADPDFAQKHNITVAPLTIHFGKESFRDGVDISPAQFFARLGAANSALPTAASPTPEQFTAVYDEAAQSSNQIVSIHLSSKLGRVWRNAKAGSEPLAGRCNIQVIDSMTTSVGLGLLVEAAARAAADGATPDDIVRIVRGLIPRVYVVFFVDSLEYLAHNKRFNKTQAILGAMLGIKPFLAIEEGDIVVMEKLRNRLQATEKLIEFASEFSELEHLAILQSTPEITADTRLVLDQLAIDFPGREFPVEVYGPALATYLGPNAMGVIVFEGLPDDN